MVNKDELEELLKDSRRLKYDEFWKFRSLLDDFQKDVAVLLLLDRLDHEEKTAADIWNLLAQEEDQYHPPKAQDENDG